MSRIPDAQNGCAQTRRAGACSRRHPRCTKDGAHPQTSGRQGAFPACVCRHPHPPLSRSPATNAERCVDALAKRGQLPLLGEGQRSRTVWQEFAQTGNAQICSRRGILTRLASRSTLPRPTRSGVSTCSHHALRGRGQPSLGRDFRNRLFSQRTERLMKFQTKSKQIDRLLIAVKTLVVPPL